MKLQIASNINMDSLRYYLKEYSFEKSCSYGNYVIDLVDKNSILYKSNSDVVIFFIDMDEFNEDIDGVLSHLERFLQNTNKIVILNTLCSSPFYIDTFLHQTLKKEIQYNNKLLEFAKKHQNVLLFDLLKLSKKYNIFDDRYWYTARIKFSKIGFEVIADEIKRLLKAYKYGSKKVLILDMDNTLWGGVIGEDEIKLANDGIGKIFLDFQKKIKKLKEFGILLSVCSKNNYDDAMQGLEHPNSILKENDFIVKKINWNDKVSNIKSIANELNLGLNSFVFIDDSPVERELVKTVLPEVEVPEFPKDIYNLNRWFVESVVERYFSKISLTKEDIKKQEQYEAKLKRDALMKNGIDYEDFLKSLDIKLTFYINDDRFVQRYAQMTQKTNQFNLTTKRYTINDIKNFLQDAKTTIIAVEYKDKFANEGIIGLVILIDKAEFIEIDTFLLSCRVLKRNVEKAIFKKIDELFGDKDIIGIYKPTKKNMQVKDLYLQFGFEKIDENKFIKRR